ncbi:NAD(P)/FAD-dependent oxidoreductase [Salinibaculum rarum]|uniref:NAD(P)/FAD-dependent oxidoreductase n=1 Tax=Salinibaculum rarum TaxID=3058903 RepID=UPI00265DC61A|nr:FAD-dependent oxidoreductase [Salinibaculum sp. KK48]
MHVAVLGAGYAGISLTRKLEKTLPPEDQITLVDERSTHLVQHLIHRVVSHPSLAEDLQLPIEDLLDRAEFRQAEVTGFDPDTATIDLADGTLSAEYLAVTLGAETAFYEMSGVRTHATPLKRIEDAEQIRDDFADIQEHGGSVVVGGAGLSGIQIAGELASMAEHESDVEVHLVERLDTVAPNFPERFQRAVDEELRNRGVTVHTGRTVEAADDDTISFADGGDLAYDQFIWTGGIAGQDVAGGDRPQVRADLRLGDRAFVAGDTARVVDADGQPAPASAQTAVRQADVAAKNIGKLLAHERSGAGFEPRLDRYRYTELGWLVSVGDGAVAQVGGQIVRGRAAKALKTTVGAGYLTSIGAVQNASEYVWEKVGVAEAD